jgi:hypothetical protein
MSLKRRLIMYAWIALVAMVWVKAIYLVPKGTSYEGTKIELSLHYLQGLEVNGGLANLKAASNYHFILESISGRVIESRYTQPPLGWSGDYHVAEQEDVSNNLWTMTEGGPVTVQLTSEKSLDVFVSLSENVYESRVVALYVLLIAVAVIGLIIIVKAFKKTS